MSQLCKYYPDNYGPHGKASHPCTCTNGDRCGFIHYNPLFDYDFNPLPYYLLEGLLFTKICTNDNHKVYCNRGIPISACMFRHCHTTEGHTVEIGPTHSDVINKFSSKLNYKEILFLIHLKDLLIERSKFTSNQIKDSYKNELINVVISKLGNEDSRTITSLDKPLLKILIEAIKDLTVSQREEIGITNEIILELIKKISSDKKITKTKSAPPSPNKTRYDKFDKNTSTSLPNTPEKNVYRHPNHNKIVRRKLNFNLDLDNNPHDDILLRRIEGYLEERFKELSQKMCSEITKTINQSEKQQVDFLTFSRARISSPPGFSYNSTENETNNIPISTASAFSYVTPSNFNNSSNTQNEEYGNPFNNRSIWSN